MSAVTPPTPVTAPGSRLGGGFSRFTMPRAVSNFSAWWISELRGVFQPLIEKYWVDRADTIDIRLPAEGEAVLPPKLNGRDVRVLVDWAHVLRKTVSYPAVVEENLAMVLASDLDRQTPFTADQIYLTHRVLARTESADGVARIDVELTMVLRRVVAPLIERIRISGGAVYSVIITDPADGHAVELLPVAERAPRRLSQLQKINLGLLATLIALFLAAIVVPIAQRRAEVLELQPMVDKAKNEADATRKIEAEFQRLSQEYQIATTKKYQAYAAVDIIEELTRLSPDTTWLQSLEMKSPPGAGKNKSSIREVQLIGEAASASKMIEALEQSPLLQNTTQRAQTTRGSQPNTERFQIATELKPRVMPEMVDLIAETSAAPPPATSPAAGWVSPSAGATAPVAEPAPANKSAPPAPTLPSTSTDTRPAMVSPAPPRVKAMQ
jgi:general secretion pathway protein L